MADLATAPALSPNDRVAQGFKALDDKPAATTACTGTTAQPTEAAPAKQAVDPAKSAAARQGANAAGRAVADKLASVTPDKAMDPTVSAADQRGVAKLGDIKRNGDVKASDKGGDVKTLQERLQGLGYDVGKHGADSNFGKDTRAALAQFQKNSGMAATGRLDAATKKALFDGNTAKPNPAANVDKKIDAMVGAPAAPLPPPTAADFKDDRGAVRRTFDNVKDATIGELGRMAVRRDIARSGL